MPYNLPADSARQHAVDVRMGFALIHSNFVTVEENVDGRLFLGLRFGIAPEGNASYKGYAVRQVRVSDETQPGVHGPRHPRAAALRGARIHTGPGSRASFLRDAAASTASCLRCRQARSGAGSHRITLHQSFAHRSSVTSRNRDRVAAPADYRVPSTRACGYPGRFLARNRI